MHPRCIVIGLLNYLHLLSSSDHRITLQILTIVHFDRLVSVIFMDLHTHTHAREQ